MAEVCAHLGIVMQVKVDAGLTIDLDFLLLAESIHIPTTTAKSADSRVPIHAPSEDVNGHHRHRISHHSPSDAHNSSTHQPLPYSSQFYKTIYHAMITNQTIVDRSFFIADSPDVPSLDICDTPKYGAALRLRSGHDQRPDAWLDQRRSTQEHIYALAR